MLSQLSMKERRIERVGLLIFEEPTKPGTVVRSRASVKFRWSAEPVEARFAKRAAEEPNQANLASAQ